MSSSVNTEASNTLAPGCMPLGAWDDLRCDPRKDIVSFRIGRTKQTIHGIQSVINGESSAVIVFSRQRRDPEEYAEVAEVPPAFDSLNGQGKSFSFQAKSTNRHLYGRGFIAIYYIRVRIVKKNKWNISIRKELTGMFPKSSLGPAVSDNHHALHQFIRTDICSEKINEGSTINFTYGNQKYSQHFQQLGRILIGENTIEAGITSKSVATRRRRKKGPAARSVATATTVSQTEVLHFLTSKEVYPHFEEDQVYQFHATGKSDELYDPDAIVNYLFTFTNVKVSPRSPVVCSVTVQKSLASWRDRSKGVKRRRSTIHVAAEWAESDDESAEILY
jgi:hypothetical protein